jgi:topoisomerase IA-like protein
MKKVSKGYDLEILDSNFPNQTSSYSYRVGQNSMNHYAYGKFTPYLERKNEMEKIHLVVLKKCNPDEYKARKKKANDVKNEEN